MKTIQKGFTLIELAIVIAILGILAAVALNNLGNTQASAECSLMKDMASQLASGYATFTAAEGSTPNGFDQYVTMDTTFDPPAGTAPNRTNENISLFKFGTNAQKGAPCTIAAGAITCTNTFSSYPTVTYQFNNGAILLNNGAAVTSTRANVPPCQ
ncbi:MAG: type II secretion system protein [Vampirovibrionales bacterium]|nr:type II secretion system protein [Vampirovibrionales bacterium]